MFAVLQGVTQFVVHDFSPVHAAPSIALLLRAQILSWCFFLPVPNAEDHLAPGAGLWPSAPSLGTAQPGNRLWEDAEKEARWAAWKRKTKPPSARS